MLSCFLFVFFHHLLPRHVWHGRLATELNLSKVPESFADERQERESHNRTRMWLTCFVIDHCLSIQSGKAWMVQEDAVRTCHALSAVFHWPRLTALW